MYPRSAEEVITLIHHSSLRSACWRYSVLDIFGALSSSSSPPELSSELSFFFWPPLRTRLPVLSGLGSCLGFHVPFAGAPFVQWASSRLVASGSFTSPVVVVGGFLREQCSHAGPAGVSMRAHSRCIQCRHPLRAQRDRSNTSCSQVQHGGNGGSPWCS